MRPLAHVFPCQRAPCGHQAASPRGSAALPLQLREANVQKSPAFGREDTGIFGRGELNAIALGELGALDGVGAQQEHRADMLQDVLVGLRKETRQILDFDH